MWPYENFCDEFHVTARLHFKLELDPGREALLHFLEQIRRAHPRLTRLRRRSDGVLMLEQEEQEGERLIVRIERTALKFGLFSPPDIQAVEQFGRHIFEQAPYDLSLSDLDYDYLEVALAFDLDYRGNHDEIVAETLLADHPLVAALASAGNGLIDCQPSIGVALNDDCATQAYIEVKTRTSAFEVRTGEYAGNALSVVLTLRRYWGFGGSSDPQVVFGGLLAAAEQLATERVLPQVVQPLASAIASRR